MLALTKPRNSKHLLAVGPFDLQPGLAVVLARCKPVNKEQAAFLRIYLILNELEHLRLIHLAL